MQRFFVLLLALAAVLVACGDTDLSGEKPRPATAGAGREQGTVRAWRAPSSYAFQVRSRCGEQSFIGTFRIAVVNGEVAGAKGLDESAKAATRSMGEEIPTLSDLLRYAKEARSSDADVVEVSYDQRDGHPKRIEIDYNTNAIDDESCYVVTDYKDQS